MCIKKAQIKPKSVVLEKTLQRRTVSVFSDVMSEL